MSIKNLYYESDRQEALTAAGNSMRTRLLELKVAGTDAATYTNQQVIDAVPEIAALQPLTVGEIHKMCDVAGVEYIHD